VKVDSRDGILNYLGMEWVRVEALQGMFNETVKAFVWSLHYLAGKGVGKHAELLGPAVSLKASKRAV
jgi:hypothetical protein